MMTDESERQLTEMLTLRRQLDEQLPDYPSAASFAAKETWSDEIIKVPIGDACLSADGEKCSPRQSTRLGEMKETAKAHQ